MATQQLSAVSHGTDHQGQTLADVLAHEASTYVRPSAEVRHAVSRFQSAARTVARYEAIPSADMTPDEHNTWYDQLNVMREARTFLASAGQLHLVVA
ncbi:hypothetical protein [Streptomyces sp. NPDC091299]|uniref:hypothetical protein n=1 Tax=Streptomyces sp. NPDC091299 TaxID=3155302 RepID=UPI003416F29F